MVGQGKIYINFDRENSNKEKSPGKKKSNKHINKLYLYAFTSQTFIFTGPAPAFIIINQTRKNINILRILNIYFSCSDL